MYGHTELEDIHAGITSVTKTGDYSNVKIIDAEETRYLGMKPQELLILK